MINNPQSGFGNVSEYNVSGLPWVTGSTVSTDVVRLDFHKVTKSVLVRNTSGSSDLHVGFTHNGVEGSNRFTIPSGASEKFDVRTKVLFLLSDSTTGYSVFAELTTIVPQHCPLLTGSADGDPAGVNWPNIG